jgi:ABC-2 type transport system permease protein
LRPEVVYTFLLYEIKRSIARRKVLALGFFTLLIGTVPYYLLAYVGGGSGLAQLLAPDYPYIWVAGVFLPQGLFIQFTAILIAGGAMSEEYEQGTAELLLSKPVTKTEYFLGKFLGGYVLLGFIILLNMVLAVISATITFGRQVELGTLPQLFVTQVFAGVLFFTVAFMIGELMRRSSLSYIVSSALFFTSEIFGVYLAVIFSFTGKEFYRQVEMYLPTSPVSSLPLQIESQYLPTSVTSLLRLVGGGGAVETSTTFSFLLILAYFASAFAIAFAYFQIANVSRKIS